jgi:integrase/recombinase XerD
MLDKYALSAGLKKLTPHMLRHTFCKNLADSGVGLAEIARLAGHDSILTTQRYVTPSTGDLEQAIHKLGGEE